MKLFDNGILCLTEVNGVMQKPMDLTRDQFDLLCFFVGCTWDNIVECRNSASAALECGIASSLSDVRRMIKGNAFGVGPRKITSFEDELSDDEFFETGIPHVRWSTVKNGKKKNKIVLIMRDDFIDDPWFGVSYEEWHNERFKDDIKA